MPCNHSFPHLKAKHEVRIGNLYFWPSFGNEGAEGSWRSAVSIMIYIHDLQPGSILCGRRQQYGRWEKAGSHVQLIHYWHGLGTASEGTEVCCHCHDQNRQERVINTFCCLMYPYITLMVSPAF